MSCSDLLEKELNNDTDKYYPYFNVDSDSDCDITVLDYIRSCRICEMCNSKTSVISTVQNSNSVLSQAVQIRVFLL